ncbi:MAG: hypothetical protein ACLTZY_03715 [Alistipes indistinctus]
MRTDGTTINPEVFEPNGNCAGRHHCTMRGTYLFMPLTDENVERLQQPAQRDAKSSATRRPEPIPISSRNSEYVSVERR